MLASITLFALGSALAGAAQNMDMLIVGRGEYTMLHSFAYTVTLSVKQAIQGFGGGGCLASVQIINADMIPLPERGKFQGITAL